MNGIFKRSVNKVFSSLQSLLVNVTEEIAEDVVDYNGVPTPVVSLRKVMVSNLQSLPENSEYDLEQQLKAGVKPDLVNCHGLLSDFHPDVTNLFNGLVNKVDSVEKPVEKPIEVFNEDKHV